MTDRKDKIRERAYGIWEEEGHPHGRAADHWQRAVREVEGVAAGQADLIREKPAPRACRRQTRHRPRSRHRNGARPATGAVAAPKRATPKHSPKKS